MALNFNKDAVYRAAKPKDKDYSISDGGGLALKVKPDGTKRWTFSIVYAMARKITLALVNTRPPLWKTPGGRRRKRGSKSPKVSTPAKSGGKKKQPSNLPNKTKTGKRKAYRSWTVSPILPGNGWRQSPT
nr:hypothetical protein [Methylomonas koyamae]